MAPFRSRVLLLVLLSSAVFVFGDSDVDDEATIEVEEPDQYQIPEISADKVHLVETFDDIAGFNKRWVKSEAKKQGVDENIAKYDGKWEIQAPSRKIFKDDLGLVLTTEAKHAAISTLLNKPFEFNDRPLVVQYEVTMQEGQNCGGAYIKLLSRGTNTKADLRKFYDQTAYTIMFGPDKCGNDNKLHFIFRHQNPRNGTFEEKHSKKPTQRLDEIYKDKEPHLYTLIVRPDNTYSILVDNKEVNAGTLLEDFNPPVNPPEEIDDPDDKKPDDWDEREKIVDPSARKPDDWDESAPAQIVDPNAVKPDGWLDDEPDMVPDPSAVKPDDWDEEMDGEWEAPLVDNPACSSAPGCGKWTPPTIPNPNYKGVWRAPLVPNPNYKGKWMPRRIANPDYFRDENPFKMTPIHAVGFELWSMSPMLLFDNLLITDDPQVAEEWAAKTFGLKRAKISKDSKSWWGVVLRATNYRPGSWALYGIYVAIPIVAYIVCLLRTTRKESAVDRALQYVSDNPWVYVVVILVTFFVFGLIAYYCCGNKDDPEVDVKKLDITGADDPHESEREEDSDAENAQPQADNTEPDDVVQEEVVEDAAPLLDTEGAGDGQRKRKPRKE